MAAQPEPVVVPVTFFDGSFIMGQLLSQVDYIKLALSVRVEQPVQLGGIFAHGPVVDSCLLQTQLNLGLQVKRMLINGSPDIPAELEPSERPYLIEYELRLMPGVTALMRVLNDPWLELRLWEQWPSSWIVQNSATLHLRAPVETRSWWPQMIPVAAVAALWVVGSWYFRISK